MPRPKSVAPAATTQADAPGSITNETKGFTLHLGDGRTLAFGESAVVTAELADAIRRPAE